MKILSALLVCSAVSTLISCGPTGNNNAVQSAGRVDSAELDEDAEAPLGLTGLGDRVCRLEYSFVKKDAAGNYTSIGDGSSTDNVQRTGLGRGCLNYCVSTFEELLKVNAAAGTEVLLRSCHFANSGTAPAAAAAATPAPAQPAAAAAPVNAFQSQMKSCKIVAVDQSLIFAGEKTRAECATECSNRDKTNPQRSCKWGPEVLREHPKNQCIIRGGAGKVLYKQETNRFECRMQCDSRKATNPGRSCLWGADNVKAP